MVNRHTKFKVSGLSHSNDILGGGAKNLSEALQMQRDSDTGRKYEISHLKSLAIGEFQLPSRTLKLITTSASR